MLNKRVVQVWRKCGCRISGFVYEKYVHCRKEYKKAVKEAKHKSKRAILKDYLILGILKISNNFRNIGKLVQLNRLIIVLF